MATPTYDVRVDWNSDGDWSDSGEDVTARVLNRSGLHTEYGRDQARALSPPRPGEAHLEVDNQSRDYSPENSSSPLAGNLGPGRQLRVQATHLSVTRSLFRGYLDDFEVLPDREHRSVALSALDGLGRIGELEISTPLVQGLRTGDAIGYVLDAVGWTADRDLDAGATTLRWWWEEGTDARTALARIVAAEGPPALIHIGPDGEFIFRDRHHRISRSASTSVQATFRDAGTEPLFSDFTYDAGWRDIVNHVLVEVTERDAKTTADVVWTLNGQFSIAPGETKTFEIIAEGPVADWVAPTQGAAGGTDADFMVSGSGTLSFTFDWEAGQSNVMRVSLPLGGSSVTVLSAQVRGYMLQDVRRTKVSAEDTASITIHGRKTHKVDAPSGISIHDAQAIADIILSHRASRLPIITMTIKGGNDTRLTQQLDRDLSDRIRVIEAETGLDANFFIDRISHAVTDGGKLLKSTFGCEKALSVPTNLFTFDASGKGFDDGRFAATGVDDPNNVFRFDTSGQGFDQGLLGN